MFANVRSVYQAIGVMLFLIAMYIVLTNGKGVQDLVSSVSTGSVALAKQLQGTPTGN